MSSLVVGAVVPRQGEHRVDVVADHRGLGAHRAHHLELAQLLLEPLGGLLGHLLAADPVLELGQLVLELVLRAQLLLDRLHLLVEVVLLLVLLHLLLDPRADLLLDLEDLDLILHELVELLEARAHGLGLEQLLLGSQLEVDVGGDRVGQARRVVDALHAHRQLGRDPLVELDVVLECGLHRAHQRRELGVVVGRDLRGLDLLGLDVEELGRVDVLLDLRPALALHQHLDRAVGQAKQLDDGADRPVGVDTVGLGVVDLGLLLRAQQDVAVVGHRLLERIDRLLAAHEQGHDLMGKDDQLAQRKQGNLAFHRGLGRRIRYFDVNGS